MTEEALKIEIQEALTRHQGRFPVSKISPRLARGIVRFQEREHLGVLELASRLGLRKGQIQHLRRRHSGNSTPRRGRPPRWKEIELSPSFGSRSLLPIEIHAGGDFSIKVPSAAVALEILRGLKAT